MCGTCGCHRLKPNANTFVIEDVESRILSQNDQQANRNRQLLNQHNILCINLMSSPGSGKTQLLESTIDALSHTFRVAVIEGDLETENDAQRIRHKGVPAVQIQTGTACHLDAEAIAVAMQELDLATLDILFIENVGNLVCPASFDLGHHQNVTLLATTEGDDKPAKYPVMFRSTDLCIINKADLLPHLPDFNPQRAEAYVRRLGNPAECITLSAKQPQTIAPWSEWLLQTRSRFLDALKNHNSLLPRLQNEGQAWHKDNNHEPTPTVLA